MCLPVSEETSNDESGGVFSQEDKDEMLDDGESSSSLANNNMIDCQGTKKVLRRLTRRLHERASQTFT